MLMVLSFFCFMLSMFVSFLVFFVSLILNMRTSKDREKVSPFECGFDPKGSSRIPFSLRFFVLAVIFLVFDIEIALLMPTPMMMSWGLQFEVIVSGFLFIFILILGLVHEWREGSLDWSE